MHLSDARTRLVSVVLCTRNRASMIRGAIEAAQRAADAASASVQVEIIVVDNGSSDGTAEVVRATPQAGSARLQLIDEPRVGVCRAKNRGIEAAGGDIIVFTDDDCRLAERYFQDLATHYGDDASPMVRGGRVELGGDDALPFTIKTLDERVVFAKPMHPGGFIHGCNLSMTRTVLDRIGGFDERFGPGAQFKAAEDTEMVYRAHKVGIPVEYVPDMVGQHFHGRTSVPEIRRLSATYEMANGAMHAHFGLLDPVLARHLYWNARNCVKEWFGGERFDEAHGLSYSHVLGRRLQGILAYRGLAGRRRRRSRG